MPRWLKITLMSLAIVIVLLYSGAIALRSTYSTCVAEVHSNYCPAPGGWTEGHRCGFRPTCPGHPEAHALKPKQPLSISNFPQRARDAFEKEHLNDIDSLIRCEKNSKPTLYAVMATKLTGEYGFGKVHSYSNYYFDERGVLLYQRSGISEMPPVTESGTEPDMSGYSCDMHAQYSKECYTPKEGPPVCEQKLWPSSIISHGNIQ